jgi:hypothetical protein
VYSNSNYIYLVGLDGDLLREIQMEEFVNSLSFELQDQRIFISSEKQISEFFLRRDFQFCFLKESGQLIFQEKKDHRKSIVYSVSSKTGLASAQEEVKNLKEIRGNGKDKFLEIYKERKSYQEISVKN